jgi:predicted ATPase/class 3 adenylate cyclase
MSFLFTDLEGSTKLWNAYRDQMRQALDRHDELIATSVQKFQGRVFKYTGDGLCADFSSTISAVVAAATAQQALAAADWESVPSLKSRMAVHVGEAERRGEDWTGPALNRTARLMGIGHGGQILLSGAAHELVADEIAAELGFVDLGLHRLRDLARAEHVWQVVGPGLERSFPALKSFDGRRGRLPPQTTSFVGRTAEIRDLVDSLSENRLVTLIGPGGVGKSRLAVQAGVDLADSFGNGVWMCELATLDRAVGLDAAVLEALAAPGSAVVDPRAHLLDVLGRWQALLILDNCEHLIADVTALVRDVLSNAPQVTVLATSRERLHLAGEHVVTVQPMTVSDDAVQLFLDRATELQHNFKVDDAGRLVIGRICDELDGLPLAIELAAARTIAMTPTEIAQMLDQRFRLLATRTSDPASRHGSLRSLVDWSYDLLTPAMRSLFAELSVFSGSFHASAAGAVCGLDDDLVAIDRLSELVDKSLVAAAPVGQVTSYRLLETMRQYGGAKLTLPDRGTLHARHSRYYADLAERSWEGIRTENSQAWFDLLDSEFSNIRAAAERSLSTGDLDIALRLSGGLHMYNHMRRLPEIYRWVRNTLDLPGAGNHGYVRYALAHHAYALWMSGDVASAESLNRDLIASAPNDDDPLLPMALAMLGLAIWMLGHLEEGERLCRQALELSYDRGPRFSYDAAEAIWNLSVQVSSPGARRDLANELLALGQRTGHPRILAGGLILVGDSEDDAGRAIQLLAEARDLTARTGDTWRHLLAGLFLSGTQAIDNPRAIVEALPSIIDEVRTTGQHIALRLVARSLISPLVEVGLFDCAPLLDGVSSNYVTRRPELTSDAIRRASRHFGHQEYERRKAQAATRPIVDIEQELLDACRGTPDDDDTAEDLL